MKLTVLQPLEEFGKSMSRDTYLIYISLVASLCGVVQGFEITQSELLLMDNSFLAIMKDYSEDFISRFIVLFYAGEMLGALSSYFLSDHLGRSAVLIYSSIICIVMIVWSAITESAENLLSARFFIGYLLGVMLSISPVYLSEIAPAEGRGHSIGYLSINTTCGSLLAICTYYSLQSFANGWRIALAAPILALLLQAIMLLSLPESPRWLMAKINPGECLIAMRQLRKKNDVSKEFNDIYRALTSDARLGDSWLDIFSSSSIRLRLFVAVAIQLMQQLVGIQIITIFGYVVLDNIGVHNVLMGLFLSVSVGMMGGLLMLHNADRVGRKFLLLCGSIAMSLSWAGAAACAYWGGLEKGKAELYFTSYLLRFMFGSFLCLFSFSYSFSLGPIAWTLAAEIFPYRVRAKASSLTTCAHFISAVLGSGMLNELLKNSYQTASSLIGFSLLCFAFGVFVYMTIPETNGIMLEQMEELFYVEDSAYFCGCFPDVRVNGILGRRTLSMTSQKSIAMGSKKVGSYGSTPSNGFNLTPSANPDDTEEETFEPTSLHKYSTDLRETKFNYFQDDEDDILASTNLFAEDKPLLP